MVDPYTNPAPKKIKASFACQRWPFSKVGWWINWSRKSQREKKPPVGWMDGAKTRGKKDGEFNYQPPSTGEFAGFSAIKTRCFCWIFFGSQWSARSPPRKNKETSVYPFPPVWNKCLFIIPKKHKVIFSLGNGCGIWGKYLSFKFGCRKKKKLSCHHLDLMGILIIFIMVYHNPYIIPI